MLEELKKLLEKYNATISIQTEGEGYNQTYEIVIETRKKSSDFKDEIIAVFNEEITQYNL